MKFTLALSVSAVLLVSSMTSAFAANAPSAAALKKKLSNTLGLEVVELQPSPIAGMQQAITARGVFYISDDGSKLIHGNIYDMDSGMKNLTDAALAGPRKEMIKQFEDKMLVYKAKNQKHVITVFTDITCGYCRKLHSEMKELNDAGITVRYLAFPRQGVPSANADNMRSVWCAADPLKAMTDAQNGKSVPVAKCDADIAGQYHLGSTLGVNGTPAIVLEDGTLIPGYQPVKSLLNMLEAK
ncbi:MAG: bifunctional protein-disulfide isomerase/oxidoreductase DsbC [Shewanella sp.]|nr:bifunctional protein-disulfide isomerase/oxidoreductase DsbC [Shewanella sp.]MCF1431224.1 bifunctional protein-disulfide isomerase/oxidoreductase DsbC [Shewanella sp.]MCF1459462.1 bifunctional protein-disulfide isomerase/oxidoreductase DsbC [Shewanella sp.]